MRTTIEIQDQLLEDIIHQTNAKSKKKAVETALQDYVKIKRRLELANLIGNYDDFDLTLKDLDKLRERK